MLFFLTKASKSFILNMISFTSLVDQESSGFSVSYTMGSMTFGGAINSTDNVAGNSGNDEEGYEVSVSFAF